MSSVSSSKGIVDVDITQLGQGGSERIDFLLACFGLKRGIKIIYRSNSTLSKNSIKTELCNFCKNF